MLITREHKGGKFSIRPEKLHHVLVVRVGAKVYVEDVKARTLGLNKPLTYAQVEEYAKQRIDQLIAH